MGKAAEVIFHFQKNDDIIAFSEWVDKIEPSKFDDSGKKIGIYTSLRTTELKLVEIHGKRENPFIITLGVYSNQKTGENEKKILVCKVVTNSDYELASILTRLNVHESNRSYRKSIGFPLNELTFKSFMDSLTNLIKEEEELKESTQRQAPAWMCDTGAFENYTRNHIGILSATSSITRIQCLYNGVHPICKSLEHQNQDTLRTGFYIWGSNTKKSHPYNDILVWDQVNKSGFILEFSALNEVMPLAGFSPRFYDVPVDCITSQSKHNTFLEIFKVSGFNFTTVEKAIQGVSNTLQEPNQHEATSTGKKNMTNQISAVQVFIEWYDCLAKHELIKEIPNNSIFDLKPRELDVNTVVISKKESRDAFVAFNFKGLSGSILTNELSVVMMFEEYTPQVAEVVFLDKLKYNHSFIHIDSGELMSFIVKRISAYTHLVAEIL